MQLTRLIIILTVLWLLLSGMFKPLLLVLGVISIAIVCYLSVNLKVLTHGGQTLSFKFFAFMRYCGWLIIEILISNINVIKRILRPSLPIDPILKVVPSNQKTELGRVIYANSITLTPGTVTINISNDGDMLIHALDKAMLAELEEGEIAKRVSELEPEENIYINKSEQN